MEVVIVHLIIVTLSFVNLLILGRILLLAPKGSFAITMVFPFIFIMFSTFIYSVVYIIDRITPLEILSNIMYNYFGLFIRVQNTISIFYVGLIALRRQVIRRIK
jgi:hypothetical protein